MDLSTHSSPDKLEYYSFMWSEVRLLLAAIALFAGGTPLVYLLFSSFLSGLVSALLPLSWIVSGAASGYLLYRWFKEKKLFGGSVTRDVAAFFVSVVSGLNLGLAGLTGSNIGMSISSNNFLFIIVGIIYLASAWHLFQRWKASGGRMF